MVQAEPLGKLASQRGLPALTSWPIFPVARNLTYSAELECPSWLAPGGDSRRTPPYRITEGLPVNQQPRRCYNAGCLFLRRSVDMQKCVRCVLVIYPPQSVGLGRVARHPARNGDRRLPASLHNRYDQSRD